MVRRGQWGEVLTSQMRETVGTELVSTPRGEVLSSRHPSAGLTVLVPDAPLPPG